MEMVGIDYSDRARELAISLKNSSLYIESMLRLKQASLSDLPSLKFEYAALRDLDFNITTMIDYAALENHVLEHSIHSLSAWWINPMEKDKPKDSPNSIGQLLVKHNENYMTIDELLEDPSITNEDKHKAIQEKVDIWHKDETERMLGIINDIKQKDRRSLFTKSLTSLFSLFLLLFSNAFCLYCLSNPLLHNFLNNPDPTYLSYYVSFLPLIATVIFDIFYAVMNAIRSRRENGFDFIVNYSHRKLYRILKKIRNTSKNMMKEFDEHIVLRQPMDRDSIDEYMLVESEDVKKMKNITRQTHGKFVDSLYITTCWLLLFILAFCLIVIVIDMQKGVAI